MEKNNPYLETDFSDKPKTAKDSNKKKQVMFAVWTLLFLIIFVAGIFLGISRGNRLAKDKDDEISRLEAELDQANKQIDSFGISQTEDDGSTVDPNLVSSLLAILNDTKFEELTQVSGNKMSMKVNDNESTVMMSDDAIIQIKEELSGSGQQWSEVSKQHLDILKLNADEGYYTKSSVTFDSLNDFVVNFTIEDNRVAKVLIITQ